MLFGKKYFLTVKLNGRSQYKEKNMAKNPFGKSAIWLTLSLVVICIGISILYYVTTNTRKWDKSFEGGTHILLSPIGKIDIKDNAIIDKDKLAMISDWLKQKVDDSDQHLVTPLPGENILIQLPYIKYKIITRSLVEDAGIDWQDFSENMIQNNYAVHIKEGEIALTKRMALIVPEVIDENFLNLSSVILQSDIQPSLLDSIPSLEIKLVKEVVPLGEKEPVFETGTIDRREHDGKVYFLFPSPEIISQHIDNAYISYSAQTGEPGIAIDLNKTGTDIFAKLTKENINKQLAILYDNHILIAPNIHEPILEGKTHITGKFEISEMENIVQMLNTSSLLASYEVSEIEPLSKELWAGKK